MAKMTKLSTIFIYTYIECMCVYVYVGVGGCIHVSPPGSHILLAARGSPILEHPLGSPRSARVLIARTSYARPRQMPEGKSKLWRFLKSAT